MPQPKPAEAYRKNCTLCNTPRDVLVRCQIDKAGIASTNEESKPSSETSQMEQNHHSNNQAATLTTPLKPGAWHFVCPGSCWRRVSGGVIDGDLKEGREGYRYGGMWKNKHAGISAKVPKRLKGKLGRERAGGGDGVGGDEVEEAKRSEEDAEEGEAWSSG